MTGPAGDLHLDPPVIRDHGRRLADEGRALSNAVVRALSGIGQRERKPAPADELMNAISQVYEPRAQQAEERARATAQQFVRLGRTAVQLVDLYEREDVDAAANLAREQGLLPPR